MIKKLLLLLISVCMVLMTPIIACAQVIHEVKPGDSLTKISKQYKINKDDLAKLNGLAKNTQLVLGQAMMIPGSTYIVQKGDSIWEIANRHAISEITLMRQNHLKSRVITPGQKLSIPRPPKMNIWTGTYFVPKDRNTNAWMLNNYKKTLTSIFVFEYRSDEQGNIIETPENQAHKIAWKENLPPFATLTNLSEKGFDPNLTNRLISTTWLRQKFVNNIYSLLESHDYKGVVIDFEQVKTKDRANLNQFIKELASKLHPAGMEVMMAVPPKEGDQMPSYSAGYDYRTLGKYLDRMFLMTYDWHWPGGPSGPIAPIDRVKATLDYAVSVVEKSKLMLGIPQYAYDWVIGTNKRSGSAYSTQHAIDLYTGYQSSVHYNESAAAPWFRYVDNKGNLHEVWFEDPRSLLVKFRLVRQYGLAGMGCWHLGLTMPQTEKMLLEEFNVH
ncbi:LysM peptidoglycan-binding domain-containing protein [Priestia megaterium]|uniref:LysM peptidoglycan-binding domain-containing protein n=1 Tax=Priestia megaterium TaxID=1404 RepID=A0A6H1P6L5_PRIMG|nr:glycosyl hydrolase family 18 protein [Priestia megaterium]QIZ09206.1 LysM peptidoglycan-binding domain-containing protein [Priestia megaterium]